MPGCHSKDGSVPHWHDNEQILVMISGMCRLTIDGKIFDADPGDLLFFPAGPPLRDRHGTGRLRLLRNLRARPSGPTAGLDRTIGPAL
ncbi:cupin domain-containing protein [Mesorhizobium temperatum]|uniref:cupin domain-containing protein n=1 Tax=Mesorhizobium temperatum TaxID=241416 RepID=UPI003CC99ECD